MVIGVSMACDNPNGTDTAVNWFNCPGTWPLTLTGLTITNGGKPNYPISLGQEIDMAEQSTNTGTTYNKVNVDVDLYSWGGLLGCSWHYVPTFGLLHNIDGCAIAKNCPIQPGKVTFTQPLDLGPFGSIIGKLGAGVYQLQIQTKNMDDSVHEYIGCVMVQGKITK
jgi:hypothetical protein